MSGGVLLQFKVWVGLPVKLRVTFTKIRWELTEKVRIDSVKSGLIPHPPPPLGNYWVDKLDWQYCTHSYYTFLPELYQQIEEKLKNQMENYL